MRGWSDYSIHPISQRGGVIFPEIMWEITDMPVQLTIFLLLFGGLQALLFSIFLIRKKLYRAGYAFLLLYFSVLLLQVVLKVMSKGWLMQHWGTLYQLSYQLPFLYGPLIYLFIRQQTGGKASKPKDVLHLIPFFTGLLLLILRGEGFAYNLFSLLFEGERRLVFQLASLCSYHWLAYACWKKHDAAIKKYFSELRLRWLRQFILMSLLLCVAIALTIYFMYVFYPALNGLRMGFLSITVFIYWVSYCALTRPGIFMIAHLQPLVETPIVPPPPRLEVHRSPEKYSNSGLAKEEARRLACMLEDCMNKRKPHLDPELTIDKLAAMISCNRHHLSQVLNTNLGLGFYEYVNYFRVCEARVLLADELRKDHKIASIAYDAGFNSLSSFNDVFKKMTGQTPSQYRKAPQPGEWKKIAGS